MNKKIKIVSFYFVSLSYQIDTIMAYRKYTSKLLTENLGLKVQKINLFKGCTIPNVIASQRLQLVLEVHKVLNLSTEKAVSEQLVAPILTEVRLNIPEN